MDPLARITLLYHFTDLRNVAEIRRLGGLLPLAELERRKVVVTAPASDEGSRAVDRERNLHKYVHLCFKNKHPMEYVAKADGRIKESVFLSIDRIVLTWPGVLFTAGMANTNNIEFHHMDAARAIIDYEVLYDYTDWSDPGIQSRLQLAEKYEILVPTCIPLNLIGNLPNG